MQYLQAGQGLAFQVLQAGAATGGDVAKLVVIETEHAYGGRGIATADDGKPIDLGQRFGHSLGACRERGELEHAHGSVPEHRLGRPHAVGEVLGRRRADVQAHLAVGHRIGTHNGRRRVGGELRRDDDVRRQHQVDALGCGLLDVPLGHVDLV